MSQRLDVHPATLHRILKTLEEQDYLTRLAGTEHYQLGPSTGGSCTSIAPTVQRLQESLSALAAAFASGLPCPRAVNVTPQRFRRELAAIRRRTYAFDDNVIPGVRTVSAAVMEATGAAAAAVIIIGISGRLSMQRLHEMVPNLKSTVQAISSKLGYVDRVVPIAVGSRRRSQSLSSVRQS
jgi:IclR family KDG regulon transcriptional repressor